MVRVQLTYTYMYKCGRLSIQYCVLADENLSIDGPIFSIYLVSELDDRARIISWLLVFETCSGYYTRSGHTFHSTLTVEA